MRAVLVWTLSLPTFGAIALVVGVPLWAGVGGISAWVAAGSNLYEFLRRGGVTDHLPVMPHARGNLADVVIVIGAMMFLAGLMV